MHGVLQHSCRPEEDRQGQKVLIIKLLPEDFIELHSSTLPLVSPIHVELVEYNFKSPPESTL